MRQPSTASVALALAGVALFAFPLVSPPQAPPDTVVYEVEPDFGDQESNPNLAYANFSDAERRVFDGALANEDRTYSTEPSVPLERITPPEEGIRLYNVERGGDYDALQVRRLSEPPSNTAIFARIASLLAGVVIACYGGYRTFAN